VSRRLRFSTFALRQLESALAYIADESPKAARKLERAIVARLRRLKRHPSLGRMVPELGLADRREVVVSPFRIIYRVTDDEVRVLAVIHGRRRLEEALPPPEED
jgi:plasmid stabilization system protein ParE